MAPPLAPHSTFPRLSLFFFLCIAALPWPSASGSVRCHPNDKKALLQLKKSLGNPYVLTSWDPETDCCTWYCVRCDPHSHRIVDLIIANDPALSAHIPPALSRLPYLQNLEFHKLPGLAGPIPAAIADLTNLKFLIISWTNISGQPPASLARLTNLTFLDLSFNKLSGTIPPHLSLLPNLEELNLGRNRLTGEIPGSFADFAPKFQSLYLSHNQLTGGIPESLGKLNLTAIDLSRNRLQGDASMLLGANKTVERVDLSRNSLDFDLTDVAVPGRVTYLDISHNKIYGRLPAAMTRLELQYLNVSYNRLCGPIPRGGKLQSFDSFAYFHNRCLCGAPLESCREGTAGL